MSQLRMETVRVKTQGGILYYREDILEDIILFLAK